MRIYMAFPEQMIIGLISLLLQGPIPGRVQQDGADRAPVQPERHRETGHGVRPHRGVAAGGHRGRRQAGRRRGAHRGDQEGQGRAGE